MFPLGLNPWIDWTGRWRHLLQGEDHSGNSPRSVLGFLRSCSGMFRNGSGLYRQFRVQTKIFSFRQSTQNSVLCPIELLRKFLCFPALYLLDTWEIYSSIFLGTAEFHDWPILGDPSWFSPATAANFLLILKVAISEEKTQDSVEDWNSFQSLIPTLGKQNLVTSTINNETKRTSSKQQKFLLKNSSTFTSLICTFPLALNKNSKDIAGESTLFTFFTQEKRQLWREINTFLFVSFFIDCVFIPFERKFTS